MVRMRRCGRRHITPGTCDLLSCALRHHFLTYLLAFLKSLTWLRNVSYEMISTADRWYSHRFTIVTTCQIRKVVAKRGGRWAQMHHSRNISGASRAHVFRGAHLTRHSSRARRDRQREASPH